VGYPPSFWRKVKSDLM